MVSTVYNDNELFPRYSKCLDAVLLRTETRWELLPYNVVVRSRTSDILFRWAKRL